MSYDNYTAGIQRNIARNRAIAASRRRAAWMNEENTLLIARAMNNTSNSFVEKMLGAYHNWGSLTEGQKDALIRVLDQIDARKAEYATKDINSTHVGIVGKREIFGDLTIGSIITLDTRYGTLYINLMRDVQENVVVYKGSKPLGEKGETISVLATVKEHADRNGVKQTVISRPVVMA